MADIKVGEIRVEIHLDEDGGEISSLHTEGGMSMVSMLGHLRMAEDTLLHAPEDDDDDF